MDPKYQDTFYEIAIGLAHVDLHGQFIRVNDYLCDFLGYSRDELIQLSFQELTLPEDLGESLSWIKRSLAGETQTSFTKVKRYKHKEGRLVWAKLTTTLIRDSAGKPDYFISSIQDVADLKQAEAALDASLKKLNLAYKELTLSSRKDSLTNAFNFRAFREEMTNVFQRYQRDNIVATLVFIDVDKFKNINDQFGHLTGDAVLQKLASTLMSNAREIDIVARYGGDEFAVILLDSNAEDALRYCQRVGDSVSLNLDDGRTCSVGVSYGVCEIKKAFNSMEQWLEQADKLMYAHKPDNSLP